MPWGITAKRPSKRHVRYTVLVWSEAVKMRPAVLQIPTKSTLISVPKFLLPSSLFRSLPGVFLLCVSQTSPVSDTVWAVLHFFAFSSHKVWVCLFRFLHFVCSPVVALTGYRTSTLFWHRQNCFNTNENRNMSCHSAPNFSTEEVDLINVSEPITMQHAHTKS